MRLTKSMIAMSAALLLLASGCSTYQLASQAKEVSVDTISPNSITVSFCGNAFMTQKDVEKYALQRACTEALAKGCSHFVVVKKNDNSKMCPLDSTKATNYSGNFTPADFVEPNITLTIRCLSRTEKAPDDAIDAAQYLEDNFPGMKK
jgi:hypothetical protein